MEDANAAAMIPKIFARNAGVPCDAPAWVAAIPTDGSRIHGPWRHARPAEAPLKLKAHGDLRNSLARKSGMAAPRGDRGDRDARLCSAIRWIVDRAGRTGASSANYVSAHPLLQVGAEERFRGSTPTPRSLNHLSCSNLSAGSANGRSSQSADSRRRAKISSSPKWRQQRQQNHQRHGNTAVTATASH